MTFGERLTELRKENGYSTRNEFAKILQIPSTTLRNYETGAREPGHKLLRQLAEYFNVSIDYLLCLTDEKEALNQIRLNKSEYEHIEKYHNLDCFGRETVDIVLERECQRVKEKETQAKLLKTLAKNAVKNSPESIVTRTYPYFRKIACAGTGFYFDDIPAETMKAPLLDNADFLIGVNGDSMKPDFSNGDILYVKKVTELKQGEVGIFTIGNECYIKELGEDRLISKNKDYKDIKVNEDVRLIGKVIGKLEEKEESYDE